MPQRLTITPGYPWLSAPPVYRIRNHRQANAGLGLSSRRRLQWRWCPSTLTRCRQCARSGSWQRTDVRTFIVVPEGRSWPLLEVALAGAARETENAPPTTSSATLYALSFIAPITATPITAGYVISGQGVSPSSSTTAAVPSTLTMTLCPAMPNQPTTVADRNALYFGHFAITLPIVWRLRSGLAI